MLLLIKGRKAAKIDAKATIIKYQGDGPTKKWQNSLALVPEFPSR